MPIYSFKEFIPVIDPASYIHDTAVIIGNVIIGKHVYIGPNAVLRGDWGLIMINDGCNVQENCFGFNVTLHNFHSGSLYSENGYSQVHTSIYIYI